MLLITILEFAEAKFLTIEKIMIYFILMNNSLCE